MYHHRLQAKHSRAQKVHSVAGTSANHEAPDDKAARLAAPVDTPVQPSPDDISGDMGSPNIGGSGIPGDMG